MHGSRSRWHEAPRPLRPNARVNETSLPDYKPVSVPGALRPKKRSAAAIPLGREFLPGSSNLPGSPNGAGRSCSPIWSCSAWGLPCRRALPRPRCALTAPFHPYPDQHLATRPRRYIFCGTFRKIRFERIPPAVSRHAALWRPDFPPAIRFPVTPAAARPASSVSMIAYIRGAPLSAGSIAVNPPIVRERQSCRRGTSRSPVCRVRYPTPFPHLW